MAGHAALVLEDLPKLLVERPAFRELEGPALERLIRGSRLVDLKPNDPLVRSADEADRFYFIIQGQIGVTRVRRRPDDDSIPKSHLPNPGREYLLHLYESEFFSDEFLSLSGFEESPQSLTCVAVMRSALLAVPRDLLRDTMSRAPLWAASLRERNAELRSHFEAHQTGDLRVVQDFFLQHNFSYATTMKVIDLDRCIGCDGCERACADRHGVARLQRKGPVLGRLSFAVACRTCVDHRCYDACGFDAIALAPNEEVRINQDKCVGCAACFSACPNNVITMQEKPYSGADFKEQIPETDLEGHTNLPGLFLVGEATGTALIKLAINTGRKAVEVAAQEIAASRTPTGPLDVIVVGAGPAGLSAALTAKELDLRFEVFDKGHFATTINSYPRHKVVMAEPAHIPLYGKLWLKDTTKEELIGHWKEIIEKTGLQIRSHEPVEDVQRQADGTFEVTTAKGKYQARAVVLATGTRGAPRKLDVPGEVEPRVQYALTEPGDFRGKACLVVGGGDSAVEAAMSLADVPGTTVTLSYRKDSFGRIKARNKSRLEEYSAAGKCTVILESSVKAIGPGQLTLKTKDGSKEIPNDQIFAMLGAEPPTKFFQKVGIKILEPGSADMERLARSRGNRRYASKCDHCADHKDQACISACPTGAIIEIKPTEVFAPPPAEDGEREPFRAAVFEEGVGRLVASSGVRIFGMVVTLLALLASSVIGAEAFLRSMVPEWSLLAHWQAYQGDKAPIVFAPGIGLGYTLGIVGMSLMALTALYPLHSRLGLFRKIAKTRFWLGGHILAGILGPVFVTYHTTLKLDRWPSIAFWLMWLVVMTGALGRHIYTWVRRAHGLTDFGTQLAETERRKMVDELGAGQGHTQIMRVLDLQPATAGVGAASAIGASLSLVFGEVLGMGQRLWLKHVALRDVADRVTRDRALDVLAERRRQERRALLFERIGSSVSTWRRIHLLATIVMFAVGIAHVVAAMLFKVN